MSRRLEIHLLNKLAGFAGSMFTVHRAVFPLNGQRPLITDIVQSTDNLFETNPSASHTTEIPETAGITESGMAAEHTDLLRGITPIYVLHMHMEDTVGELINEIHIIYPLISHMARIVIEPECRMIIQRIERFTGRISIECYFRRMHLQTITDT